MARKIPDRWLHQVQSDLNAGKEMLLRTGEVSPMFIIHSSDGNSTAVATGWSDVEQKDKTAAILRTICIAEGAVALSFLSEAWMRSVTRYQGETEAEHKQRTMDVPPSEAEDRIEIMVAETTYRNAAGERRSLVRSSEMLRDFDGKVTGFKDMEFDDLQVVESRWFDLLPPRPPTATEQRIAKALLVRLAEFLGAELTEVHRPS